MLRLKMGLDPKTVAIDKENRRLNGVIAIEPIDIKDWRPFTINDEFIQDLVTFAEKQKAGVKSHFGHNYNNLGKMLGRAKNWRVEDGKAKYDLDIYESADKSPGLNGLGTYILELLSEDNKAMMTSIVFKEEYFYQLDSAGQKLKVYYVDKKSGEWVRPNPTLGKVYPQFGQLYSTDLVEEGAATNSMFSIEETEDSGFLSELKKFFTELFQNKQGYDVPGEILELSVEPAPISSPQNQEMDTNPIVPEADAPVAKTIEQLQAENEALKIQLATKPIADENAALKARIAELEKQPAAAPTVLNSGAGGDSTQDEPLWMQNPINKEAQELFSNQIKKA